MRSCVHVNGKPSDDSHQSLDCILSRKKLITLVLGPHNITILYPSITFCLIVIPTKGQSPFHCEDRKLCTCVW